MCKEDEVFLYLAVVDVDECLLPKMALYCGGPLGGAEKHANKSSTCRSHLRALISLLVLGMKSYCYLWARKNKSKSSQCWTTTLWITTSCSRKPITFVLSLPTSLWRGGGGVLTRWTNLLQDKYRSLTRRFNSEYAHSEGEHNEDNSAAKSCGMWNKSVTQPGWAGRDWGDLYHRFTCNFNSTSGPPCGSLKGP